MLTGYNVHTMIGLMSEPCQGCVRKVSFAWKINWSLSFVWKTSWINTQKVINDMKNILLYIMGTLYNWHYLQTIEH